MKKWGFSILIISVILVSGCLENNQTTTTTTPPLSDNPKINITSEGFEPNVISIEQGKTVTFVNKDTQKHWPASDVHPTHKDYPEKGGCIGSAFDACKGLPQGENYSFTFEKKGEWTYHDHLNPSMKGTIIVK